MDVLAPYRSHHAVEAFVARGVSEVIGHSSEGRPLHAVTLGPADARRVTVVLAGIHALEWIGVEVGLALLERLRETPPVDRRVLFFPLVNVDGYCAVERDRLAGRRRFRRGNARGVDLNRNFPTHFRAPRLLDRLVPIWNPGSRARSEPEIDAVVARIDREVAAGATVDRGLSLHSVGNKILHAYGGRWTPPVAVDRLRAIARAVRDRMHAPYEVLQSSRWVPGAFAHGMELDHLCDAYGAEALLIECSRGGASLAAPRTLKDPFAWFNPADPRQTVDAIVPALEWFVGGHG
ncbi:MAG: hypothetical protein JNL79_28630 [Myxococcales bacterium]|nr:hypothetical protein [Myxococcales bacterium]